ncbi:MAG: prolyl oligopeptidase family serine peptidase [Planctomycetota bacterium]|nr:prolyl oligopeptidase family serine peptidase [Planctomycetota bacterium]
MKLTEFDIHAGGSPGRTVTCLLAEPDDGKLAADPALVLNFAADRKTNISEPIYDIPTKVFVEAGHRALAFDMPHHGQRIAPWKKQGIEGFVEAMRAGVDSFVIHTEDAKAAIDEALKRGLARPGRIAAAGTSRGGYCALRLAAADPRVDAVAAYAPVVDWWFLTEFAADRERPEVAKLALTHFIPALAGRPAWMAIGNEDRRVNTVACIEFALALARAGEAVAAQGPAAAPGLAFHLVDGEKGHTLSNAWRTAGAEFLLKRMG